MTIFTELMAIKWDFETRYEDDGENFLFLSDPYVRNIVRFMVIIQHELF